MSKRWDHDKCTEGSGNVDKSIHSSGIGHIYAEGVRADLTSRGCEAMEKNEKMKLYK